MHLFLTGKYGAATTIYFSALQAAGVSPYTAGFIAGTVQVSLDGAAPVNVTNLPTHVGNGIYSLVLAAAEMQHEVLVISAQAAAAASQAAWVTVRTTVVMSRLQIDASLRPASSIAMELTGSAAGGEALKAAATGGTSNGILATGTATAVGIAGTSGTGAPTNFFDQLLEDILAVPTPGVTTLKQAIASLVARLYYLVTQTSTQQKQYKSDSVTLVCTSGVSDDGITQTKGRAT